MLSLYNLISWREIYMKYIWRESIDRIEEKKVWYVEELNIRERNIWEETLYYQILCRRRGHSFIVQRYIYIQWKKKKKSWKKEEGNSKRKVLYRWRGRVAKKISLPWREISRCYISSSLLVYANAILYLMKEEGYLRMKGYDDTLFILMLSPSSRMFSYSRISLIDILGEEHIIAYGMFILLFGREETILDILLATLCLAIQRNLSYSIYYMLRKVYDMMLHCMAFCWKMPLQRLTISILTYRRKCQRNQYDLSSARVPEGRREYIPIYII